MKAIIHLSNGNQIHLNEYETEQVQQKMTQSGTLLQFSNENNTTKYTIDLRGIAYLEYV